MTLHVDDDGFVRAPATLLYRRLTNMGAWPRWWPGVGVAPLETASGGEAWRLELRRDRLRGLRLAAVPFGYRHEVGFRLALSGDVAGEAEFWLEPVAGGTVVHHLLAATATYAPLRTLTTYRTVLRRGLWGLKDRVQGEVRTALGMLP